MAEQHRFDRALAFCRQAALLEPNVPHVYADALVYAGKSKDADAVAWAAGNLARRDWPAKNQDYQLKAKEGVAEAGNFARKADIERIQAAMERSQQRDLSIKLSWSGTDGALSLQIKEPTGSNGLAQKFRSAVAPLRMKQAALGFRTAAGSSTTGH